MFEVLGDVGLYIPYTVGIMTAVFSVGITMYGQHRKERLDALKAVQSEIKENRQVANEIVKVLSKDIDRRKEDGVRIWRPRRRFQTDAYSQLKSKGHLFELGEYNRDSIAFHYDFLRDINDRSEFRATHQVALNEYSDQGDIIPFLGNGDDLVLGYDNNTVAHLYAVCPSLVREKFEEEWEIKALENQEENSLEEVLENGTEEYQQIAFEDVCDAVDSEIEKHTILNMIL